MLSGPRGGLLLDLDGTLVDSEPVHAAAYREYFSGRGWHVDSQVISTFTGRRAPDVFATLPGPWSGEDPMALTDGVLDALARTTMRYVPVEGAAALIMACAQADLPVAVVTSARRSWVLSVLDLLGVGEAPMLMVTAEDCSPGKPDPEPFIRGADLLGRRPMDLVAVEDSRAGIRSARGAGIGQVIAVTTSSSSQELLAAGAHTTVCDLVGLATVVGRLPRVRAEAGS